MYKLYQWYAWNFGKWVWVSESQKIGELRAIIKGRPSMTYKIEKDGVLYEYRISRSWRCGMAHPILK